MRLGVALPGAAKLDPFEPFQPMIGGVERMLPGQQQARPAASCRKGKDNGRQFDRFRAGSDHKVDTRVTHFPPSSAAQS